MLAHVFDLNFMTPNRINWTGLKREDLKLGHKFEVKYMDKPCKAC